MRLLASLCCAAVLGCSNRATRPDGTPAWLQLETDHFVLLTDVAESDARDVARQLEEVRAAMIAGSWHGNRLPADKIEVIELADRVEMREFMPPRTDGFFAEAAMFGQPLMVMSAEQSPSRQPLLKHELAHQLSSSFLLRGSPWVHEGLACYLQTLRYDHSEERYVLGEPDQDRLFYLNAHPETDLGQVLAMTPEQAAQLGADQQYAFETASWLVMFFLANERGPQLDDYIRRLARAEDPAAAFDAAFGGLSVERLWRDLATYQQNVLFRRTGIDRTADYRAVKLQIPKWTGSIEVTPLGKADVAAIRGELFLYSFGDQDPAERRARARAAADEALAADPTHPLALAVRVTADRNVTSTVIESVRAATRSRPNDPRAWQLLGEVLPDSAFLERKAALQKAAALAPNDVAVLDALAWDHVRGGRAHEALPVAVRAATLSPGRASALDALGVALAMAGRCADALKVQQRAVELMPERASARYKAAASERLKAFRDGCKDVPLK